MLAKISRRIAALTAVRWRRYAVFALLVVGAFGAGRMSADDVMVIDHAGVRIADVEQMRAMIEMQRTQIELTRDDAQLQQGAILRRLGQMQAQLERLNAAGQRLAAVAMVDAAELGFGVDVGAGGPEEPVVAPGSAQAGDAVVALDELAAELAMKERQLDILERLLLLGELNPEHTPFDWPVLSAWISSGFGKRRDPFTGRTSHHAGMDFAAHVGEDIHAVAAGVVSFSGRKGGYGNMVEINHGNGYVTRYAHNSRNRVRFGDQVAKGDVIAEVGNTGRSTGAHLHFEVLIDGVKVNPRTFVAKR